MNRLVIVRLDYYGQLIDSKDETLIVLMSVSEDCTEETIYDKAKDLAWRWCYTHDHSDCKSALIEELGESDPIIDSTLPKVIPLIGTSNPTCASINF